MKSINQPTIGDVITTTSPVTESYFWSPLFVPKLENDFMPANTLTINDSSYIVNVSGSQVVNNKKEENFGNILGAVARAGKPDKE